jgi:mRNA-degrading endonuclease RelE of RelBE toxin-antitoxin system
MNFSFLSEADEELDRGVSYYDDKTLGLGEDFYDEIISGVGKILDQPEAWPKAYYKDCRKFRVDRFHFQIIYKYYEARDYVLIIAIAHDKRQQGYWQQRI